MAEEQKVVGYQGLSSVVELKKYLHKCPLERNGMMSYSIRDRHIPPRGKRTGLQNSVTG
jgi:hypothetical protein